MMMVAFLAMAAASPQAETPRQFMTRVYAQYRHPKFNPLDDPDLYFAPRFIVAIQEDSRLAHGEVGYLDGDPVCQCQDPAGMRPVVGNVTQQGSDGANVEVSIRWPHDKPTAARFSLIRLGYGWRIADVSSAGEASLLDAIEASNRAARAKHQ